MFPPGISGDFANVHNHRRVASLQRKPRTAVVETWSRANHLPRRLQLVHVDYGNSRNQIVRDK